MRVVCAKDAIHYCYVRIIRRRQSTINNQQRQLQLQQRQQKNESEQRPTQLKIVLIVYSE